MPLEEKLSKDEVGFEHPAQGSNQCRDCVHFQTQAAKRCDIVAGRIMPQDWCKRFAEKK